LDLTTSFREQRLSERALERKAECVEITIDRGLLGMSMLKRPKGCPYGIEFSHFTGTGKGGAEEQAGGRLIKGMVLTRASEEEIRGLDFKETKKRLKHRPITLTFQPAVHADDDDDDDDDGEEEEEGCCTTSLTTSKPTSRTDDSSVASSCYSDQSNGRYGQESTFSEYGESWKGAGGTGDALMG
jgi:hypothetical protein